MPSVPGTGHVLHGAVCPALSPDGSRIAYLDDRDGVPAVWTQPCPFGPAARVAAGPEPVLGVSWSLDGAWLAVLVAPGGGTRTQVWVVRPDGTGLRRLAGDAGSAAFLGAWSPDGRLGLSEATGDGDADALLVDPADGSRATVATGGFLMVLDVAPDGSRALLRSGPRGGRTVAVVDLATGRCRSVRLGEGPGSTDLGWLSADGETAWVRSDVGREMPALVRVDLVGRGRGRVVAAHADAELDGLAVSADRSRAVLLWNRAGTSGLEVLDLDADPSGPPAVIDLPLPVTKAPVLSRDGSLLALTMEGPGDPADVWITPLPEVEWRRPRLPPYQVPPPIRAVVPTLERFRSADGTEITGWLYLAAGAGAAVVYLHGGPEAQERPGHMPLYQELVGRGISVLAANVRGSSGFGRTFLDADNVERRLAVVDDVAACADHLVELGVADPSRIGVMGRSYGGWLTLAALVTHPERYAAGVDICGMSDLETFYRRTEPWIAAASYPEYGHPVHDRAVLRALSPVHRIDRLAAPLLVIHGANDTNVPVEESLQLVAAARRHGAEVDLLIYEGEGHELAQAVNRAAALVATVDFLARHLCREL